MADDTGGSDPLYIACRENRENRPPVLWMVRRCIAFKRADVGEAIHPLW